MSCINLPCTYFLTHLLTYRLCCWCCRSCGRWLQMCTDLRLLASMKEVEEPFEKEQIGKLLFIVAPAGLWCITLTITQRL